VRHVKPISTNVLPILVETVPPVRTEHLLSPVYVALVFLGLFVKQTSMNVFPTLARMAVHVLMASIHLSARAIRAIPVSFAPTEDVPPLPV
jgi:hypothetical protein